MAEVDMKRELMGEENIKDTWTKCRIQRIRTNQEFQ
jgi:hypothetical protein